MRTLGSDVAVRGEKYWTTMEALWKRRPPRRTRNPPHICRPKPAKEAVAKFVLLVFGVAFLAGWGLVWRPALGLLGGL